MKQYTIYTLRRTLMVICCILAGNTAYSQFGILYNSPEATDGLTLFTNNEATFLINNCGEVVNRWPAFFIDNHAKLLPNGNILYMKNNTIIEMDWDGNIVKSLLVTENNVRLDYEVIKMANGNYLCVGRRPFAMEDFIEYGLTITNVEYSQYDVVVEVDGENAEIVWQWDIIDHIIQDEAPDKKAYGVVKDFPGKLDINALNTYDWNFTESFMINGMDYNSELDLIALSVRKLGEVIFIDHSTTTAEAKTSAGGNYGMGGDAIYRFGNPANYDAGREVDRVLFFQHNPNWIKYGEYEGSLMIFNNLLSTNLPYSSVEIITPQVDSSGNFIQSANGNYEPLMPNKRYSAVASISAFVSGYTSGGKVMPSNNILVTTGQEGRIREFNEEGALVWEYGVPNETYIFRSVKYDISYPGFSGRDLKGDGVVEFPPSPYDCTLTTLSTSDASVFEGVTVRQEGHELLISELPNRSNYWLYNRNGALLAEGEINNNEYIQTAHLVTGLYFLSLESNSNYKTFKVTINH